MKHKIFILFYALIFELFLHSFGPEVKPSSEHTAVVQRPNTSPKPSFMSWVSGSSKKNSTPVYQVHDEFVNSFFHPDNTPHEQGIQLADLSATRQTTHDVEQKNSDKQKAVDTARVGTIQLGVVQAEPLMTIKQNQIETLKRYSTKKLVSLLITKPFTASESSPLTKSDVWNVLFTKLCSKNKINPQQASKIKEDTGIELAEIAKKPKQEQPTLIERLVQNSDTQLNQLAKTVAIPDTTKTAEQIQQDYLDTMSSYNYNPIKYLQAKKYSTTQLADLLINETKQTNDNSPITIHDIMTVMLQKTTSPLPKNIIENNIMETVFNNRLPDAEKITKIKGIV